MKLVFGLWFIFFQLIACYGQEKQGYIYYDEVIHCYPAAIERKQELANYYQLLNDSLKRLNVMLDSAMAFPYMNIETVEMVGSKEGDSIAALDYIEIQINQLYNAGIGSLRKWENQNHSANVLGLTNELNQYCSKGDCVVLVRKNYLFECYGCSNYSQDFTDFLHQSDSVRARALKPFMVVPGSR